MGNSEKKSCFEQIGSHKGSFILYLILRIAIAGVLFVQIRNRDWQNVFLCIATLILFLVPSFVETKFHIRLPAMIQNILLVFIFCAEILGEIEAFYVIFPWWDTVLHTINGFIVAAFGFSLVSLLNESEKVVFRLSSLFVAITAFCFSMTVGVCWEFGEFGMDCLGWICRRIPSSLKFPPLCWIRKEEIRRWQSRESRASL